MSLQSQVYPYAVLVCGYKEGEGVSFETMIWEINIQLLQWSQRKKKLCWAPYEGPIALSINLKDVSGEKQKIYF